MIKSARNRAGILCYWSEEQNASKVKSRKEEFEQIDLVAHCRQRWPVAFDLMLHPVNESKSATYYRAKLTKLGLKTGASDWFVLIPAHGKPYMVLELKRSRKRDSSVSKEQVEFLLNAERVGAFAVAAYGYKAALQAIADYFENKP